MRSENITKCVPQNCIMIPLMSLPQQSKDVEDKLKDLDLWLSKLENTDDNKPRNQPRGGSEA